MDERKSLEYWGSRDCMAPHARLLTLLTEHIIIMITSTVRSMVPANSKSSTISNGKAKSTVSPGKKILMCRVTVSSVSRTETESTIKDRQEYEE